MRSLIGSSGTKRNFICNSGYNLRTSWRIALTATAVMAGPPSRSGLNETMVRATGRRLAATASMQLSNSFGVSPPGAAYSLALPTEVSKLSRSI